MGTTTTTDTYTIADVANVVRRFRADMRMIAESSGAITTEDADRYAEDVETLAKRGYLASVDVTLINLGSEIRALRYTVNTEAGGLETSRPGNVMWPRLTFGSIRVVLTYTEDYDAAARRDTTPHLSFAWGPNHDDISHADLAGDGGRDYVSGAYGMNRKDWTK